MTIAKENACRINRLGINHREGGKCRCRLCYGWRRAMAQAAKAAFKAGLETGKANRGCCFAGVGQACPVHESEKGK